MLLVSHSSSVLPSITKIILLLGTGVKIPMLSLAGFVLGGTQLTYPLCVTNQLVILPVGILEYVLFIRPV